MSFSRSQPSRQRSTSSERLSSPQSNSSNGGFGGLNFDFPRINIQNITQSFTNRSFSPPTFSNFMFRQPQQQQPRSSSAHPHDRPMDKESSGCENCGVKFNFLKRRKTCTECSVDFCASCFAKDSPGSEALGSTRRGYCRRCRVFSMQPLERKILMSLRVKDLRWYLAKRRVSAHLCKEKSDLVDLILQHHGYMNASEETTASSVPRSRPESRRTSLGSRVTAEPNSTDNSSTDDSSWVLLGDEESEGVGARLPDQDVQTSGDTTEVGAAAPENTDSPRKASDFKPFNIDDITTEEEVQAMTVRQMKLVLTRNFVDYKGCCEKDELLGRVLRLWKERREARDQDPDDISDENCCKICMESVIDCVLLECGHMVTCTNCGKRLNECPICRQYVVRAVRIFKS